MFPASRYSFFFRFTYKVIAFTFFFAVGIMFTCMVSTSFGAVTVALIIGAIVQKWILPIFLLMIVWIFIAVLVEAL
jgi:hypothetical protein